MGYHGDSHYESLLEEERAMHSNEEDKWMQKKFELEARIEYLEGELMEVQNRLDSEMQEKESQQYGFEEQNQQLNWLLNNIVSDLELQDKVGFGMPPVEVKNLLKRIKEKREEVQ